MANHGQRAEDTVEAVCAQLFGSDYVLRSPVLLEPSGAKELTDILVLVDDTMVVIQSKSLELDVTDIDSTNVGRVLRRQKKAASQLGTTLNAWHRRTPARATIALGLTFDIDWRLISKCVGVVAMSLVDRAHADPENRFQFGNAATTHRGIVVHTLLVSDLRQMARELTTPADVLAYLDARRVCVSSGRTVVGNELDLLALFKTRYPELTSEASLFMLLAPGLWEEYSKDRVVRLRDESQASSYVVGDLVRHMHAAVEYSSRVGKLGPQEKCLRYLQLIGKLGMLARVERTMIAQKLLEKVEKARSMGFGYFVYVRDRAETAYVFLLMDSERDKRVTFLSGVCAEACHRLPVKSVVGFATAVGPGRGDMATDAMVTDAEMIRRNTKLDPGSPLLGELRRSSGHEWSFLKSQSPNGRG